MNKKMMAIFMSALMAVAAMCIVVASPSDAADNTTEDGARYIIGDASGPVVMTYDADGINGKIKFNEGIFTNKADVNFEYKNIGDQVFAKFDKTDGKFIYDNNNVKITISKESMLDIDRGKYTVNVVGSSNANVLANGVIKVIVRDYYCTNNDQNHIHGGPDCIVLGEQNLYYKINVKIISSDKSIELIGWNGIQSFEFEKNVYFKASVVNAGNDVVYRYYATGLPTGISMRVDGTIGGMLSNNVNTDEDEHEATVYAAYAGNILVENFKWKYSNKPDNGSVADFTMEINGQLFEGTSFVAKTGQKVTLKLNPIHPNNVDYNWVVKGSNGTIDASLDGEYTIVGGESDINGAGVFEVVITAKINNNDYASPVTKSFTVYVVGSIVDADLSPTVTSK